MHLHGLDVTTDTWVTSLWRWLGGACRAWQRRSRRRVWPGQSEQLADLRERRRYLTNLAGLITQRSQVQILPPLRKRVQVRGHVGFTGRGL
jgi:hypothetical protein